MLPLFALGHLVGKALSASTKSEDFKNGTSAWHKGAAIGMSVLLPGSATAEMRRDAFRK